MSVNISSIIWVIILSLILAGAMILNYAVSWREFCRIKVGDWVWVYSSGTRVRYTVTFVGDGIIKLDDGYSYTLKDYMNGTVTKYLYKDYL